ncbi:MAG: rhomboid family intramembrane serine protease [Planctomycetota bacterium]|jgi:membrane associated rhomboid family serine protease
MFLPLSIEYDYDRIPYATGGLVVFNVVCFVAMFGMSDSVVSALMLWPNTLAPWQWWTSGFLHGGIMHLAGNMLFLWVYGRYLEQRLGPSRFLLVYFALAPIESLAFILTNFGNDIPALGASGVISGLMGIVMATAASARVKTFIWWGPMFKVIPIAAGLILGLWVFEQLMMASFGAQGIAISSHLGGFAGGFLIGMILKNNELKGSDWYLCPAHQTREDLDARLKSEYYSYLADYNRSARNGPVGRNEIPEWIKSPPKEETAEDPYEQEQLQRWNQTGSKRR